MNMQEIIDGAWALRKAEQALCAKNRYITDHIAPLSQGGPHDFYSNADYWWPNPDTSDGMPYVCRDGESNPGNFGLHRQALRECRTRAAHLAAAYRLTGEERYARAAASLLEGFFLSKGTRMRPHLLYAQAVPGRDAGNAFGVIDGLHLAEIPFAARALEGSPHITAALANGLKQWFGEYLHWLKTHPQGIAEMNWGNNHTICWHVQAASFAQFIGDEETLAFCRDAYKNVILPKQMAPNGSFPRELRRTKPYGYSIFALDNLLILCRILSASGESLWEFALPDGRGARKGLDFLYPYLLDKSMWPHARDIEHFDAWPVAMAGFLFAGIYLGETKYIKLWRSLDPDPRDMEVRRNMAVRQPLLWL